MTERKEQARIIRLFRKIHRTMGAYLFVLFFVVSITGLLLGWKKNSNGIIHPISENGISSDVKDWLPLDSLQTIAFQSLQRAIDKDINLDLQRIDARPEKGIVKFVFENNRHLCAFNWFGIDIFQRLLSRFIAYSEKI